VRGRRLALAWPLGWKWRLSFGLQNSWALIEHGGFKQQKMWVSPAEIEI